MSSTAPSEQAEHPDSRRRSSRRKGDLREEQILAVVRELVQAKPLSAITIDDITSAAGVSRTAFYFYFASKEAVLTRLMDEVSEQFAQSHVWLATDGPNPERLIDELTSAATIWQSHGSVLACTLRSGYDDAYPLLGEYAERDKARFRTALQAKIERDQAAGLAPAGISAETLAWMIDILRNTRLAHLHEATPAALAIGIAEIAEAILRLIYAGQAPLTPVTE